MYVFPLFFFFLKFRTSKDSKEILRQYMSHILKGLSKRNTYIPHIALFEEDKWHKRFSYFVFFRGGGHFWRVTHFLPNAQFGPLKFEISRGRIPQDLLKWDFSPNIRPP